LTQTSSGQAKSYHIPKNRTRSTPNTVKPRDYKVYKDKMMTAIEEQRKSIHSEEEESSVTLPNATRASHDNTKTALVEKPKKYWAGSNFLQAVNACDKLFNCGTFVLLSSREFVCGA
jgi:hypothetical protein